MAASCIVQGKGNHGPFSLEVYVNANEEIAVISLFHSFKHLPQPQLCLLVSFQQSALSSPLRSYNTYPIFHFIFNTLSLLHLSPSPEPFRFSWHIVPCPSRCPSLHMPSLHMLSYLSRSLDIWYRQYRTRCSTNKAFCRTPLGLEWNGILNRGALGVGDQIHICVCVCVCVCVLIDE